MTDELPDQALDVLRTIWSATGQSRDDIAGSEKSCRKMSDVGFDGMAGADGDLRAAWRATLEREGKLNPAAGGVLDPGEVRR
jgi:hypothetical protein